MSTQKIALFGTPGEPIQRLITEAFRRRDVDATIVTDEKEFPDELVCAGHECELKMPVKEYMEY